MIPQEKIIDPRELRIGNYLLYDGKIVYVTALSLDIDDEYEEQILFCELGKTTDEKGGWNRALAGKLDRIEITPEWFASLGFEETNMPFTDILGYAKRSKSSFIGFTKQHAGGFLISAPHLNFVIHFIHQIQNLYNSLTGEDLIYQP